MWFKVYPDLTRLACSVEFSGRSPMRVWVPMNFQPLTFDLFSRFFLFTPYYGQIRGRLQKNFFYASAYSLMFRMRLTKILKTRNSFENDKNSRLTFPRWHNGLNSIPGIRFWNLSVNCFLVYRMTEEKNSIRKDRKHNLIRWNLRYVKGINYEELMKMRIAAGFEIPATKNKCSHPPRNSYHRIAKIVFELTKKDKIKAAQASRGIRRRN